MLAVCCSPCIHHSLTEAWKRFLHHLQYAIHTSTKIYKAEIILLFSLLANFLTHIRGLNMTLNDVAAHRSQPGKSPSADKQRSHSLHQRGDCETYVCPEGGEAKGIMVLV